MKRKSFTNGGGRKPLSFKRLRDLKAEVAELRRERNQERQKAFLCAIQRDFYHYLVGYFEEYVLVAARTEEQLQAAKQHYYSFAAKRERRYADEAREFVAALYGVRGMGAYTTLRVFEPYPTIYPTRLKYARAATQRELRELREAEQPQP